MQMLNSDSIHEIIINKSRFICSMMIINDVNEIDNKINEVKLKYKDATHYCYAYIIDNVKRFNDDGEPGGTAGMPILNVLENNNLNYVLCVVIRYFGGIKLGAGGLVRAYTKSVTSCLETADIKEAIDGFLVELVFDYNEVKVIDNVLKNIKVIDKSFDEDITYNILISNDELELLKDKFNNICKKVTVLEKRTF